MAVADAIGTRTTPGRGEHSASALAAEDMLKLRTLAARMFDVSSPERVVLTINATHALNLAIKSLVKPGDTVVISGYEHNAVTRSLHAIGNVSIRVVNGELFREDQMIDGFNNAMEGDVKAVICTHVSNVFGYVLPIDEIASLCKKRGVALIVDASQSAGILPVSVDRWDAAYVAMPGHKGLYGPQGTGLLLCGDDCVPDPLLHGGTGSLSRSHDMPDFLPDRLEAGTQNIHGAVGLLEGLRFVDRFPMGQIMRHEGCLMEMLADGLRKLKKYLIYHSGKDQSVLSIVPVSGSPEELSEKLSARGVATRAGLHCAPLAHLSAGTDKSGTLRFSASVYNTESEIQQVLKMLR